MADPDLTSYKKVIAALSSLSKEPPVIALNARQRESTLQPHLCIDACSMQHNGAETQHFGQMRFPVYCCFLRWQSATFHSHSPHQAH